MNEPLNTGEQLPVKIENKFSVDDMKAFFYLMNAKPDTSVQLLKETKKITHADIRDLNERVQRKLQNHQLVGQIASINLHFDKGKILDYGSWAEYERENWKTINQTTEAISIEWDIQIKLPRYENPQRHTIKVRIGNSFTPKDVMELMFQSDNPSEIKESMSAGIIKVDFIDQVIASEIIERIVNWYDGLVKVPRPAGFQKRLIKHKRHIVGITNTFFPVLLLAIYHYYFIAFCSWGTDLTNTSLANIQLALIIFISIYFMGRIFASIISNWIKSKIDSYKYHPEFNLTKGDQNAFEEYGTTNSVITKDIVQKLIISVIAMLITFGLREGINYLLN